MPAAGFDIDITVSFDQARDKAGWIWDNAPIVTTVEAIQNSHVLGSETQLRDVYITGFDTEGRFALIVDVDNEQVTIAPLGTMHGLGRWECTKAHYAANTDLYHGRFPLR
jgi:hypothetical protein